MHPEALVYMLQQAVVLSAITSGSGKFKNQTEAFDAVAEECKKSAYFDGQYRDLLDGKKCLDKVRTELKKLEDSMKQGANRSGRNGEFSAVERELRTILEQKEAKAQEAEKNKEEATKK